MEISENFNRNRKFSKILSKVDCFQKIDQIWDFLNISTKIEMFRQFWSKSRFFGKLTKIKIFEKGWPKSSFWTLLNKTKILWKFSGKSWFFENFVQNQSDIWTKYEINKNFDKNRDDFRKFWQNRDFQTLWLKSRFFENFDLNPYIWKFWPKSRIT